MKNFLRIIALLLSFTAIQTAFSIGGIKHQAETFYNEHKEYFLIGKGTFKLLASLQILRGYYRYNSQLIAEVTEKATESPLKWEWLGWLSPFKSQINVKPPQRKYQSQEGEFQSSENKEYIQDIPSPPHVTSFIACAYLICSGSKNVYDGIYLKAIKNYLKEIGKA